MQQHASKAPSPELMDEQVLNLYTNKWFVTRFCWLIPNVKEMLVSGEDKIKAALTKAVISLRQDINKNDQATSDFDACVTRLVRGHLDAWALDFGFAQQSQASAIQERKNAALEQYKAHQNTISTLNSHMGMRASAAICLLKEKQQQGINYLTIMHMLKKYEGIFNQGLVKSDLLKYTISLHNELGQAEYAPVISHLANELGSINAKVQSGLEKLPAGILGKEPVKTVLQAKLNTMPEGTDKKVVLTNNFEQVSNIFCKVNSIIATKLARTCQEVEKNHNILSIAPTHQANDDF